MNPTVDSGIDALLVDIKTMRETAQMLLGPDDALEVPASIPAELNTLTAMLRGHLELLIPKVEQQAERLPKKSVPRHCALACVGEARRKLRLGNGCTPPTRVAVGRKLARCVNALCDHYENLRAEQQ